MQQKCTIYVDRLKDGQTSHIKEEFSPDFLQVEESSLSFPEQVAVEIKAYLSEDHLVLHINAEATSVSPCVICNQPATHQIKIQDHYHTEELSEIPAVFNCLPIIRECILLEIKDYLECSGGTCPDRDSVASYMKKKSTTPSDDVNYPFANLM